jgi:hypothetical protein
MRLSGAGGKICFSGLWSAYFRSALDQVSGPRRDGVRHHLAIASHLLVLIVAWVCAVVPMNALLQHRNHLLVRAGR